MANKFLIETCFQLQKYFLNIGVNFDIQKPVQYCKQLFSFASTVINALNAQVSKFFLNFLYSIDLIDEKVQSEMQILSLTFLELIVKRELQNFIIKNYYSKPENQ